MLKINSEQALERWDTLPDNIREALFSPVNADIVWRTGETNHLTEDKTERLATLAGDVLMGFLHSDPDEVAKEIQERIGLPSQLASDIAEELNRKIFSPLRNALDQIYAPPLSEKEVPARSMPSPISEEPAAPAAEEVLPPMPSSVKITPPEPATTPAEEKIPARETAESDAEHPFILHEEKPFFTPQEPPERPSFTFRPTEVGPPTAKPKPVTVKVEMPNDKPAEPKPPPKRVVHYSEFRTPLEKTTDMEN